MKKIRLFVKETAIKDNQIIKINENDANYLTKVMRKKIGDELLIFNGLNGQWLAKIIEINKRNCQIQAIEQNLEQYFPPNITLAFAPVKNVRIDFIASKATELGVTKFCPIITARTIVNKINLERFTANIKEATEQCERIDIPQAFEPVKLNKFLSNLTQNQILILCDESGEGKKASEVLPLIKITPSQEIIIFTGPEGGFSKEEFEMFEKSNSYKLSLGPRILRADTAIICALTLTQEFLGDF
ncbi:MAG: 16S rRNA (uracil1498-N3)-methyltransferase [Lentimonas sp.]|jgi:16S rRNA (uracil1498-N3)-methyltransferase